MADAVAAMRAAVAIPVSVKMRIGVVAGQGARLQLARYDEDDYQRLHAFTALVAQAGCSRFIVHARKAVLGGLSPRENRDVPPLRFDVVQRLKRDFPQLAIEVNGGLRTPAACSAALDWADGVMLGREAYHRPYLLAELQQLLFDDGWRCPPIGEMLERMAAYAESEVAPAGAPPPPPPNTALCWRGGRAAPPPKAMGEGGGRKRGGHEGGKAHQAAARRRGGPRAGARYNA